jgi:TetR/AcrR family transcriptional regulator, transcriptional repressor for nem operon
LDAGLRAADELGVRGLSVNAIVAEASRSKGAFFHHFPDRESYLVELHRRLHDEMEAEMRALGEGLPAGFERLEIVVRVYLDTFLARPGVRAFLLEARGESAIKREIAERNEHGAGILAEDFQALGWSNPGRAARLWIAALAEAGVVELELGRRDAPTRHALLALARTAP